MPKTDFVSKLRQIEEQANAALAEVAPGMARTRLQHIVVLAKTLRVRLEFGAVGIVRLEPGIHTPLQPPGEEPAA